MLEEMRQTDRQTGVGVWKKRGEFVQGEAAKAGGQAVIPSHSSGPDSSSSMPHHRAAHSQVGRGGSSRSCLHFLPHPGLQNPRKLSWTGRGMKMRGRGSPCPVPRGRGVKWNQSLVPLGTVQGGTPLGRCQENKGLTIS